MKTTFILFLFCSISFLQLGGQEAPKLKDEIIFSEHKALPFYGLKKSGNTRIFQGNKKKKNYFEGWYFKMVGEDGQSIISVIPGISLSETGEEQHAFIQIINGKTAKTAYYSFPIEEFAFSKSQFAVRIGENYFSKEQLILNIKNDSTDISGVVNMSNHKEYSDRIIGKRKIMGWYRKVPFMECYHGVVSLTHNLQGNLNINGQDYGFNDGKGYIEKDWGSSMPSTWIWLQSNHFENSNSSFMLSIATVPFIGKSFNGFLGFFYHKDEVYRFATYRHSKLNLEIIDDNTIKVKIKNRKQSIVVEAKRNSMGMLQAPVNGLMDRRIPESIDAEIKISLFDRKGNLVYQDHSKIAGLEMVANLKSLEGILK